MAATYKPREFAIADAVRQAANLKLGLFSPSGGGKTFSALRLAVGIQEVVGGDIVLVDTENGRGKHYADRFKFKHLDFRPPFSSLSYLDAMRAAAKVGSIVIVDSMSHEHEGPGGMLEFHEAEVDRIAGDNATWQRREAVKMLAWQKPKEHRRRLLNEGVLGVDANLILCFRAKNTAKPVRVTDDNGRSKTEVQQLGFMPIAGDEFVWEMDLAALFMPGASGVPTWKSESPGESMMIKVPAQFESVREGYKDKPLDEELGSRLAKWAQGGAKKTEAPKAEQAQPEEPPPRDPPENAGRKVEEEPTGAQEALDLDGSGEDGFDPNPPPPPPETGFGQFAGETAAAKDWPDARLALIELCKSTAWAEADDAMRARARVMTFGRLLQLNERAVEAKKPAVDFLNDAHAFRCYIEAEADAGVFDFNAKAFKSGDAYQRLPAPAKAQFDAAIDARSAKLLAAAGAGAEFA